MVFWKKNPSLPRFLVKNAKNNVFEDKWFLSKMFSQIKMQAALQTGLATLKIIKHLIFFKRQIFNAIFKNYIFRDF